MSEKNYALKRRSFRLDDHRWELIEQIALAMSHELKQNITTSDILRTAVDDLIKKWEG